jgi:hypothetical protein
MPEILICNDSPKGRRMTERETVEVYNALSERCNELRQALDAVLPDRVREALTQSLALCEKLVEVFE